MKLSTLIVAASMALALPLGIASAQTPVAPVAPTTGQKKAPAATTVTKTDTTTTTTRRARRVAAAKTKVTKVKSTATSLVTRSANSLACSADATAKGLTGKKRKAFRRSCLAQKARAA